MIKKKRAITALELMVVVVIIGLLATITAPGFRKALLNSRGKLAKANLQMILSAQKLYRVNNDSFWPDSGEENDLSEINKALNLDIEDRYFDYSVKYKSKYDFEVEATSKSDEDIIYKIGPEGFIDD